MQALVDNFVVNPADPPMALTHREIIWKRGKTRLYRYHSNDTPVAYPTPYLIVPWLGNQHVPTSYAPHARRQHD